MKRKAVIKSRKGQFYAILMADNGEPLAHTEYQTRKSRLKATLKKYFPDFEIVER